MLILGTEYGAKQSSGLSATHEEYNDAREKRPTFAFVQDGVTRKPDQVQFLRGVEHWQEGVFRATFTTPQQLRMAVTQALHNWELGRASAPLDEREVLERATRLLPDERRARGYRGPTLIVAVAGGPAQSILRPSELEIPALANALLKEALFGEGEIFDPAIGSKQGIEEDFLVVRQDEGGSVRLDGQGSMLLELPIYRGRDKRPSVLIKESVAKVFAGALKYASWTLDRIDATQRISHVALVATLGDSSMLTWRSQAEQDANPNSHYMRMGQDKDKPVHLSPPLRTRPALKLDTDALVEDMITLLKRNARQ